MKAREIGCPCGPEFVREIDARIERGESIEGLHCDCECHVDSTTLAEEGASDA